MSERSMDLNFIRRRLSTVRGVEYWRCLEELADTEDFKELLQREFPRHASVWLDSLDRREFLKVMGASLALAGLSGCLSSSPAPPDEKIVPYVRQPEEMIPGKPLFFATAMPIGGFGHGVLAESHMGRPTKVEGNPDHPGSLGASDALEKTIPDGRPAFDAIDEVAGIEVDPHQGVPQDSRSSAICRSMSSDSRVPDGR